MRPTLAFLLLLGSCAGPPVDDVRWQCATDADCGAGYLCSPIEGACLPTDTDGRNGIFADRLVFGLVLPESRGPVALARAWRAGLEAAFGQANRAGVHGRALELRVVDDGHDAERALAATRDLIERREVVAVLGGIGAQVAIPLARRLSEQRVVFWSRSAATAVRGTPADPYVFSLRDEPTEVARLMRHLAEEAGVPPGNVAVVAQGTVTGSLPDAHGASVLNAVRDGVAAQGGDPEAVGLGICPAGTGEVEEAVGAVLRWLAAPRVMDAEGEVRSAIVLGVDPETAAAFIARLSDALAAIRQGVASTEALGLAEEALEVLANRAAPRFAATGAVGPHLLAEALSRLGDPEDPATPGRYCAGLTIAGGGPDPAAGSAIAADFRAALAASAPETPPSDVALQGYLVGRLLISALEAQGRGIAAGLLAARLEGLEVDALGPELPLGLGASRHHALTEATLATLDDRCAVIAIDLR